MQILKNDTDFYLLYLHDYTAGAKNPWVLGGEGTKDQMLWAMKVLIEVSLHFGGPPRDHAAFIKMLAKFLILSPDNEIVDIPDLKEIKPWNSSIELDDDSRKIMDMLDKIPHYEIKYDSRVKIAK